MPAPHRLSMETATTAPASQMVDTADLIGRLALAADLLAELRDGYTGYERTRVASKIEGIQRCARAAQHRFGDRAPLVDVERVFSALDPGRRSVAENLTVTELGISKGVALSLDYARNPS